MYKMPSAAGVHVPRRPAKAWETRVDIYAQGLPRRDHSSIFETPCRCSADSTPMCDVNTRTNLVSHEHPLPCIIAISGGLRRKIRCLRLVYTRLYRERENERESVYACESLPSHVYVDACLSFQVGQPRRYDVQTVWETSCRHSVLNKTGALRIGLEHSGQVRHFLRADWVPYFVGCFCSGADC